MKKIPTLFKRVFDEHHHKSITKEVTPGCEVVLEGKTISTVKWDGACCAIIGGEIYKRYDAKQKYGKKPPEGAIPCQKEPDPITGHWPHWVKCEQSKPEDKYFFEAFNRYKSGMHPDEFSKFLCSDNEIRTYEAIGPAWQGNPYKLKYNQLIRHGDDVILAIEDGIFRICKDLDGNRVEKIYTLLHDFLKEKRIEGVVFWFNSSPICKIKRSDFGFVWPPKDGEAESSQSIFSVHLTGIPKQELV